MARTGGVFLGRVYTKVLPDLSGFRDKVAKAARDVSHRYTAWIDLDLDTDGLRKKASAAVKAVEESLNDIDVDLDLDSDGLRQKASVAAKSVEESLSDIKAEIDLDTEGLRRKAKAVTESIRPEIDADLNLDANGIRQKIRALTASIKDQSVEIDASLDKSSLAKVHAQIKTFALMSRERITMIVDTSAFQKATAFTKAFALSTLGAVGALAQIGAVSSVAMVGLGAMVPVIAKLAPAIKGLAVFTGQLGSAIGSVALPALTSFGLAAGVVVASIKSLYDENANLTASMSQAKETIEGFKTELLDIRDSISNNFWANLSNLGDLSQLFSPLRTAAESVAIDIGNAFAGAIDGLTSDNGLHVFNSLLEHASSIAVSLSYAISGAIPGVIALGSAGGQALENLTKNLGDTYAWSEKIQDQFASGELQKNVEKTIGDVVNGFKSFGAGLRDVWHILEGVSRAAAEASGNSLGSLGDTLSRLSTWVNSLSGQTALTEFFSSAKSAADAFSPVLGTLATLLATKILPTFADVATNVGPGLNAFFQNLGRDIQPLLDALPGLATSVGNAIEKIDLGSLLGFLGDLADTIGTLLDFIGPIIPFLDEIAMTIAYVVGVIKAMEIGIAALNLVMAMNPIGLVVAAIAALVAGLVIAYNESETFRNFVNTMGETIKNVFGSVVDFFKNLPSTFEEFKARSIEIFTAVQSFIIDFSAKVIEKILDIGRFFLELPLKILDMKNRAIMFLAELAVAGAQKALELKDRVLSAFEDLKNWAIGKAVELRDRAVRSFWEMRDGAGNAVNALLGWVRDIFGGITGAVSNGAHRAKDMAVGAFFALRDGVADALHRTVGAVWDIASGIGGAVRGAIGNLYNSGLSIMQSFKDGILSGIESARNAVSNGLSRIRNLFPFSPAKDGPFSGKGWVLYSGMTIPAAFAEGINRTANDATQAARKLVENTSAALDTTRMYESLEGLTGDLSGFDKSGKTIINVAEKIASSFDKAADSISGMSSEMIAAPKSIGVDIAYRNRAVGNIQNISDAQAQFNSSATQAPAVQIGTIYATDEREVAEHIARQQKLAQLRGGR